MPLVLLIPAMVALQCRHARVRIPPESCRIPGGTESAQCIAQNEAIDQRREEGKLKTVTKNVNYYLWGILPGQVEVDASGECANGIHEIHAYDGVMDVIWVSITVGIYMPRTVEITCN